MELKPGYKQTEVGVIPEDWEVKTLGSLVTYENGKAHEEAIRDDGRYIVVNSRFISTNGEVAKYSNERFSPTFKGDILMVMSDVPNGRAIARTFFVDQDDAYTVNQRICILRPLQVIGELLHYKINRNPYYLAFDDGVKQTNLRKDDVLQCPLAVPKSKDEQRAIVTALGDVDALIQTQDALIAKKRDIKQAAMQQLLTGKQRLPGFSGQWEKKRLGEIGEFSKGKGIKKDEVVSHGEPCIRYGEIYTRHHDYIKSFYSFIPKSVARESQLLRRGDLLFAGSGETAEEIGKCVAFLGDERVYAGGDIVLFSPRGQNSLFLGYLMNHDSIVSQKSRMGQGDAVVHISASNLAQLQLRLPDVEEQTAIAKVLADMDAEIAGLEAQRDKTRVLKQGMMQELLTGKTRLL